MRLFSLSVYIPGFLLFVVSGIWIEHEYYVSRCVMNKISEESKIEVSIHLFADDLEMALKHQGAISCHIGTKIEHADTDYWIEKYLKECFIVEDNFDTLDWTYLGRESTDDLQAVWCYLEVDLPGNGIDKLKVTNRVLMDIYDDQKNIVELKQSGIPRDVFMLRKGKESLSVQL